MEYAGTQLSWARGEARQAVNDRDVEGNKQRRKVQNRKNQRAHRKYAPRHYNPPILRNPYRTTAQGQRLGECSGVAPIPGQALAPRRARPYSLSRNLASIGARDNHVLLPSTALHVHRHTTLHSEAYSCPTRITIHYPHPARKFGPPALHFSPVLGPPPPSHSV
jgi:hypothetical protein